MSKHLPPKKNKHEKEPKPSVLNRPLRERKNAHSVNSLTGLEWKNVVFPLAAAALLVAGFVLGENWISKFLFAASLALSAFHVLLRASDEVLSLQLLEADVLVVLSSLASLGLDKFSAAALIMLCYRAARLLEGLVQRRGDKLEEELRSFLPETARIVNNGRTEETEAERVAEGDIIEVRPGEIFPADGLVIDGSGSCDASPLTGGSPNRAIAVDSYVLSGYLNVTDTVTVRADRMYAESNASRIAGLLEKAGRYRASAEKFAESFERYFTPAAVLCALVTALAFPLFGGDWVKWLERGTAILSVSCVLPLSRAISHAFLSGLVWSVRKGIIVKGHRFFEALFNAQTFVFNKTGTLTEGRFTIAEIVPEDMSAQEFLAMAAHVESVSSHPIAVAIRSAAGAYSDSREKIQAEEIPGRGIIADVGGVEVLLGNAILMSENGISCPVTKKGALAIHMAVDGEYTGHIALVDRVRENAFDQLERLRVRGVRSMVTLTSDMRSVSRPIASSLNMEMVRAELSPESKVSAVEYLMATKAERSTLAFVCDGSGDPEVLGRADVGISINAMGDEDAYERADILVLSDRLGALADCVGFSKHMVRRIIIALAACLALKLGLVVLCFTGVLSIGGAALADLVLTVLIYFNSARVITYDENGRNGK